MDHIIPVLNNLIKSLPFPVLLIFPFVGKLRHREKFSLMFALLVCGVCIFVDTVVRYNCRLSGIFYLAPSLLFLLLTVLLLRTTLDIDLFVLIFLVFFCKNYVDMVLLLGNTFNLLLPGETAPLRNLLLNAAVMGLTLPVTNRLFQNFLAPVSLQTEHFKFWRYLWFLPAFYYLMYRLIFYSDYLGEPFDRDYVNVLVTAVWITGILLSYFFLFRVMTETLESSRLKEQLHSARLLTLMQKEQYLMLQSNIEETRRNRHDLKQQLIVIQDYIKAGRPEAAAAYIASCLDQYPNSMEVFCGNYALDSVIRHYADMARANSILISVDARLDSHTEIPEIDFCTLLGNLMLNAVEACIRQTDGEKFIRLAIVSPSPFITAIDISNSYSGEVKIHNGAFYSSKRDSEGIGTVSIRQMVMKYHGSIQYNYENRIFHASILLNLPRPS